MDIEHKLEADVAALGMDLDPLENSGSNLPPTMNNTEPPPARETPSPACQ